MPHALPLLALLVIQPSTPPSLAHYRAFAESSMARESWAKTGAVVGGVGGALVFGAAFYHFTHRSGSGPVNNTTGTLGGTLVGAAGGAAGGALFGSFIGSLIPKHRRSQ